MNFGFIIPTCIRNNIHLNQLKRCIKSIRIFYPIVKIILISDSDKEFNLDDIFICDKNIKIKKTLKKGSADQQVFKIFLETNLFDRAVFIQDSMLLNKKLEDIDEIDIKFIWHFTNHRLHWNKIKEPKTIYNTKNNIKTHNDLLIHMLKKDYSDNKKFINFALNRINNKKLWCGCFGSCCIITKDSLKKINDNINFVNKFINSVSNRNRRVNESIFSLICHYVFQNINFEKSYDDLYYDGIKHGGFPNMINKETGFDNLRWCSVHNYFSKISFNR